MNAVFGLFMLACLLLLFLSAAVFYFKRKIYPSCGLSALAFATFYMVEKWHILQKGAAAASRRARVWILTVPTDYSVLKAISVICLPVPEAP